ncbi:MAG: TIGR02171 family protein [Fibrobacter sp.]|uniref:TIGR02171 family lipoprotein n=1 Tax=Fibrobacter sp. TaxID=35828 RepID=UPI002A90AFB8|nr:TIGR02171 family protein [Fibrobacter sp.]MDY6263807.1 TIGR02171 family protein [Fibrobacter sp.]
MRFVFLVLVFVFWAACSNSEGVSSGNSSKIEVEEDSLAGMLRIKAVGETVLLGTNEVTAKVNERPSMKARFDYDFSMGRTEVTCAEFNDLMTAKGLSLSCEASVPATNITYYDAVLFANERSKSEGFDTAYTYSRAVFDSEGRCTNLEGFAYRPEEDAYRLPTEAEWILVAKANWNVSGAWTSENSDYKLHPVCEKADSSSQVCDIAGNAMEWVNDWLGKFRDTTVTNFVGAPDGGALGQRIVKGGSYRNSAESITLYSRGDVYTVTSSTRADYVGFRLAFGAIPGATWMRNDGKVASSRVVPLASSATMRSLFQTYKAKLAFRNENSGNLAYIDYSSGNLSVHEIEDSLDVHHPEISPDGKYVAFCTGLEGVSEMSELYVRDLNATGSNLVKLEVESAAIPRWRVLESGDTVIVYVTDAGSNKEESAFKSASTWQVPFANGKFGKPQKLFDGAYHGGISADNALAVTGAKLLRARVSGRDTVWYGGEQACNASLAKDRSKRTLFLDFGGKTGREYAGVNYGTHERLLVVDSVGNLVQTLAAPAGYSFDHSEWVSNGNFAVATLTNANGAHTKIVLVNLTDGSLVELVEGDELWHPTLWISEIQSSADTSVGVLLFEPDSAGVYFVEGQDWPHEALGYKMNLMWKYANQVEILCVGSSRTEDGIVANKIQSGFALNMGHSGNDMNASLFVAENYGVNHLKKLKTIVVSLDFDLWQNETAFSDYLFLNTPGYIYDKNHSFWKNEDMADFSQIVEAVSPFSMEAINAYGKSRGWLENESVEWGTPLVESDSNWSLTNTNSLDWNLKRLESFVKEMDRLQINVVGVIFPQNPRYRETGSWGRYGPQRSAAEKYIESVQALAGRVSRFAVLDENRNGNHDYTDQMALNTDHLSVSGAEYLTARLDSLLNTLE